MPEYDFLNLSASEFESLTRDLLQKEFNVHIESFTEGKDGGIDLRFAKIHFKNQIIQCKKYKDYNSLITNLKKEVVKLKGKSIGGYYIATSVGLTPHNKQVILTLFTGYIKSVDDIFGKDDINNLLGKYPDIERQYYKLWLSSTNILDKILHSRIYNQSHFELEEIKELIKLYVQNDSFSESLKILNDNNFVIISGIPGIGKTTLARLLVCHLLAKGYDEFIYLNDSISDGYTFFKEESKQVFLFDDFLGSNFLETSKGKNDEKSIFKFIEKIRKSSNKALIFTTREYILQQAQIRFEILNDKFLDKSKCIIDLSKYTKKVKAQILYNHLYFSELPTQYIDEILREDFCLWLINHPNYNPRIIETFTKNRIWDSISLNKFQEELQLFFDYPHTVWKHAYENQITELSKYILAILFTSGTPILYNDLILAIQNFTTNLYRKYHINCSELDFKNSLKELENTFIITTKDRINSIAIEFQNPSIQDFLVNYFSENHNLINDLIENTIYINQLLRIVSFHEKKNPNRSLLEENILTKVINKIIGDFDKLNDSVVRKSSSEKFLWQKSSYSYTALQKIYVITKIIDIKCNESLVIMNKNFV